MPKFTTPAGTTQRYIAALDRSAPDSIPGTKKVYADRAAFLEGIAGERACIAMGLPVWYDGIDVQVLSEPPAVKRLWTLATGAGSLANNAAASHGRTVVIAFKKFTLASDDNRVHASTGAPASGLGDNGDLCLDDAAGVVYRKATGAWAVEASFGSGATGSGVTPVPYSTTVPLDGNKVMPRTQIAAAVALTIGAKVAGGSCRIPFLSNGTNVPTIAGASEWATSFGFDNSAAGLLNVLDLWSDDGTNVGYSWSQPVSQSGGSDTTAPTLSSASVANASPSVVALAFSETMDTSSTPAASAFTVSGHTVSSLAWVGGVLNVIVTPAFVNGEAARTLAYTQPGTNPLRDLAGNPLASLTGRAITNNVQPTDTTAPVLGTPTIDGATVTFPYNEALNTTAPAASAFSVSIAGVAQTPTAITISGQNVVATLATAATAGQSVTASYTVPGTNPIRDTAGNPAAAFTSVAVTNNTGADDYAAWLAELSAASGDASATEKSAVQTFINTAKNGTTPFWDNIVRINAFVNNANGSLVPFKKPSGSGNDTSPVATTVDAGGRTNTSGSGYINTQTPCPPIGGLSVYLRSIMSGSPAAAKILMGARNTDNSQVFRLLVNAENTGGQFTGSIGGVNSSQPSANSGDSQFRTMPGHYHAHRDSQTSLATFRNGAVYVPEYTTNLGAAAITEPVYIHAQNSAGTASGFTQAATSIGCYAILTGSMTAAQKTAYNNAVVALMTAMGRNL